jgi:cell filamentation protein
VFDDKYTYPNSGGVLINELGIGTRRDVDTALNRYATVAWLKLSAETPQRLDFDYLRHIHFVMFRNVLAWAGQLRDVDTMAGETGMVYARPFAIEPMASHLFGVLADEDYLAGIPERVRFAELLSERWGDLTALHPFRDGNTRSQSLFISKLAERAGHPIDWERVDVGVLRDLRLAAMMGETYGLAEYLDFLTDPGKGSASGSPHRFHGSTSATAGVAASAGVRRACGVFMPRAHKPCVLREGHKGHHRSR